MDPKIKSIIAHIGPFGWLIAFVINQQNKDYFTDFFLRQTLGLMLAGLIITFLPVINVVLGIVLFVFWIMSLVSVINGEEKELPIIGEYFQDWFKGL